MPPNFILLLQRKIARCSIGVSTARGMGPAGTIAAAHDYLGSFDLNQMLACDDGMFQEHLETATKNLMQKLPERAKYWGSARKFFNIFLRDVLYNKYLNEHFCLSNIESFLEIPLDSHVARGLRGEPEGRNLDRWQSVIGLQPHVSGNYQNVAAKVAERKGTLRIHLDLLYWRGDHLVQCPHT